MGKFLIHSLLRLYSIITIIILLLIATVISVNNSQTYMRDIEQVQVEVAEQLESDVARFYNQSSSEIYDIFHNNLKREGVDQYFKLNPAQYAEWLLQHTNTWMSNPSLHQNISDIYKRHDFIQGIDITLTSEQKVFTSTRQLKSGSRVDTKSYREPENAFPVPIYSDQQFEILGIAYITVDAELLQRNIANITTLPLYVKVDLNDRSFVQFGKKENMQMYRQPTGTRLLIRVGISKNLIRQEILKKVLGIFAWAILISAVLLVILQRVFANYGNQVSDIVGTMQKIATGDRRLRIDLKHKKRELLTISNQVNEVMDYLDESSREIYALELAQQEANLRSLQSQINPHFLYNTLEFFRMYAVIHDQEELGDMIYEFSTLMRNSISQEKMTTIERELEFCEKYSYICQIRFPKAIAYSYQLEDDCRDVIIPKFSIQPLVENYFVHGVDLKKNNNAISVKVYRADDKVCIEIRDNGKGMTPEVLERNQKLLSGQLEESTTSIGIQNIHQRLNLYFKDAYEIELYKNDFGGVTYMIRIKGV